LSNLPVDPITELFKECKDSKGVIQEELIRCTIATAFRRGYASCLDRMPRLNMDYCPVKSPQWPIDEGRVAELEKSFKKQLSLK
jgi:hypothetical protein